MDVTVKPVLDLSRPVRQAMHFSQTPERSHNLAINHDQLGDSGNERQCRRESSQPAHMSEAYRRQ